MRILKTTQTYYPYLSKGGPPAKVRAIAKALVRRGHEVTVLTAVHGEEDAGADGSWQEARMFEQGPWGLEARDEGVEAIYLRTLHSYRATTINPQLLSFCARRLKNFNLVHVYGLYDLIGSITAWFCRRRGIPYVLEPLGMFGPKVRSQKKKRLYSKLVGNALFSGARLVVATSETERDELIDGGVPPEKIVLRRNGIELADFEKLPQPGGLRAQLGLSDATPLILFLGRISFIKGLDLLVNAFAGLPEAQ
ncbi:MAG: glycosyltransferase, partial [Pyrinomonadaceae bacterium]